MKKLILLIIVLCVSANSAFAPGLLLYRYDLRTEYQPQW